MLVCLECMETVSVCVANNGCMPVRLVCFSLCILRALCEYLATFSDTASEHRMTELGGSG